MAARGIRTGLVLAALAASVMGGHASDDICPVERAIYRDADASLTLAFEPADPDSVVVSNAFALRFSEDFAYRGQVIWSQGVSVPNGVIENCPAGDVTGDELAACLLWEGLVYTVGTDGAVGFLPAEGEPAPAQILLPDFGRAVRYSEAFGAGTITTIPWDVLTFERCET